jgi:hypothetical protein
MTSVRRLWRGELPLVDAFWDWAVIGALAVNLATALLFVVLLEQGWPIAAVVVSHLSSPYNLLAAVAVWRSAARYDGPPRWALFARAAALPFLLVLSLV